VKASSTLFTLPDFDTEAVAPPHEEILSPTQTRDEPKVPGAF
jgi:hypothetical protein